MTRNGLEFPGPTSYFEYDYTDRSRGTYGSFTQVNVSGYPTGSDPAFFGAMLMLPDGTALLSSMKTNLFVYHPDAPTTALGTPVINNISDNLDGSYTLTGTGLNGISAGGAYGDDLQLDSNYPLVRFTDSNGNVRYARTFNWSSSGVMTGTNIVSTKFIPPASLAAGSTLVVVANGIASDPVSFYPADYPTVHFVFPTNNAVLSVAAAPQIAGYADDSHYTIGIVRVAVARNTDGAWYDFVSDGWGTTTFDFNRNVLNAQNVSGSQNVGWLAQLPALPNGNYTVQAQSVNAFNHASPWLSETFTIESPPVVTFAPLTNQEVVFNFNQLGGTVSNPSTVQFTIEWFSAGGNQYWNGVNWTSVATDPGVLLPANVSGLNWSPAPGTLPPRFQLAQANYLIQVYATNGAGDSGYNSLVLTRSPHDTTPPIVNLDSTSIHPGDVFTNQFLPALSGLAYDPESGVASVSVLLARTTDSGLVYWTGASWTPAPTNLPANYSAQNISWQLAVPLPGGANLPNGAYSLAVSAANNESPTGFGSANLAFSVDYHPVYIFTAGSYFDGDPYYQDMRWDNPENWDVGTVPTPDAHVIINDYSPDNTSLGSLQLYRLDLSGGTLTTAGMIITNLNVSGGALSGGAITLPASGVLNWSGGILAGTYNVPAGATMNLTGSADKTLNVATVINEGTVIWNGGNLIGSYGSVIMNDASFIMESSSTFDNNGSGYGYYAVPTFINNGTLQKTISNGETIIGNDGGGWSFNQNGTIDVENGALSSQSQFNVNGGAVFAGPGEFRVDDGAIVLYGTSTIQAGATVELAGGTCGGNNIFAGPGTFAWSGGTIGGVTTVATGANLSIVGDGPKTLGYGTLINSGSGVWTGNGPVICTYGSIFENDGSFNVLNDSSFANNGSGYGYYVLPAFVNNGSFVKTNSTGTNTTLFPPDSGGVNFNNQGSVTVRSGVLALGGGGTDANATFAVAAGARIDLNGGAHVFGPGPIKINGPGLTRLLGAGTLALSGNVMLTNGGVFEIDAGANVTGSGTFGGTGTFNWTGGTISAGIGLQTSIVLSLTGNDPKTFSYGTLTNTGPGVWTGTGPVIFSYGSVFENDGVFTVQNDSSFSDNGAGYGYYGQPLFINNGSFIKTNSFNTTVFDNTNAGVAFNNNGSVNIQSGNLSLGGGGAGANGSIAEVAGSRVDLLAGNFPFSGSLTFSGAGSTHVDGGTVAFANSLNTMSAGGTFEIDTNGYVSGSATFGGTGTFNWTGGTIGAAIELQTNIALNLSGNDPKTFDVGTLTSAGPGLWTGAGPVIFSYGSIFENSGVFTVQNNSSFNNNGAGYGYYGAPEFINNGTFRKNTTTGTTTFSSDNGGVSLSQNGTIEVDSGILSSQSQLFVSGGAVFAGAGETRVDDGIIDLTGTNIIQAGATLEFANGTWSGHNVFTGPGTIAWSGGTISGYVTVGAGANISILGSSSKTLNYGAVTNAGHCVWTGTGAVVCTYGSIFENDGVFTAQNDSSFINNGVGYGYYGLPTFINNGTFRKNTTTGTTSFAPDNGDFSLNQNGIVDLQTGSLVINGNYALSGSPQLKLVLGGASPGTQFSQETFAGDATLGGTLSVTLTNGFAPTNGQSFAIVNYASASGQFVSSQLPALPSNLGWRVTYGPTEVTLSVVSSTIISGATQLPNGHFQFSFNGPNASSAIIEGSTNLLDWTFLQTNAPFTGSLLFDDPQATNYLKRFYRVWLQP